MPYQPGLVVVILVLATSVVELIRFYLAKYSTSNNLTRQTAHKWLLLRAVAAVSSGVVVIIVLSGIIGHKAALPNWLGPKAWATALITGIPGGAIWVYFVTKNSEHAPYSVDVAALLAGLITPLFVDAILLTILQAI